MNNAPSNANWNNGCGHSYHHKTLSPFNALSDPQPSLKIVRSRAGIVGSVRPHEISVGDKKASTLMKTYRHLFEQMLSPSMVARCALDAARGKLRRKEVMQAFIRFDRTYDQVVACAKDPSYVPCEDNTHEIIDGANHKKREIEKPKFCPEQILHHLLIEPFRKILMDGLYEQVYGCLPKTAYTDCLGRIRVRKYGPHAAIRQLRKWAQIGKKLYVCEMDVHHAYGSVHIPTLARQLERVIKDPEWLRLMYQFLHYRPGNPDSQENKGLILGHYTSPWLFSFYLKEFDHFAASIPEVRYLRFADNMYLVGTNKRKVRRALEMIREYLRGVLRLELNSNAQIYRFEYMGRDGRVHGRAINAVGAVIHHNRVTLRKSILKRMRKKSLRIAKKTKRTWHDGASMLARLSWIRKTNTFGYYWRHIKPNINTRQLKEKIRKHGRAIRPIIEKRRRIINDGLEGSTRLSAGEAAGV